MLKRKVLKTIETWSKSGDKKALLLTGARQVGKTTAIRESARAYFSSFVEINFVKYPLAKKAFEGNLDTATIISNLSAMGFGPFIEGKTLVFFDEIQECPNARTAIKFLVEDKKYFFIESGSLLGINYKHVTSYPVGYEEEIKMYPLDFEEFLWAKGIDDNVINTLRESYLNKTVVPSVIHEEISHLYHLYLSVGGMPEAVQTHINNPDFRGVERVHKSIISTYRDDITNYAGKEQVLVKRVFDSIPSQLGKEDKRFVLAELEKGASRRKYEDPTQWLIDSGIAYYSFNTSAFELPFESTENRKLYKLYMVDTGLLGNLLLKGVQFQVINGDININQGALTENYVAAALASKGKSLHYYDKKSRKELDFIIEEDGKITIIEVKSGNNYYSHSSMDSAISSFRNSINRSIVLCKGNLEYDKAEGVLYLPLYMTMFL